MKSLFSAMVGLGLATSAIAAPLENEIEHPVQTRTQGSVSYLCGGVGQLESQYMKQAAGDYDVMLTFASDSGSYLADVDVDITDARGNRVLKTACGGPIMLVDLPRSGTFHVRATSDGTELRRAVNVAGKGHRGYVFRWPRQSSSERAATIPNT